MSLTLVVTVVAALAAAVIGATSTRAPWNRWIIGLSVVGAVLTCKMARDAEAETEALRQDAVLARSAASEARSQARQVSHDLEIYSDVAKLAYNGAESTAVFQSTLLTDAMQRAFVRGLEVDCSEAGNAARAEALRINPGFPFPDYLTAACLKHAGNPAWREPAQRALEIFRHTTKIPHHNSQDDAKRAIEGWFSEGQTALVAQP